VSLINVGRVYGRGFMARVRVRVRVRDRVRVRRVKG
jgi:hypothetical protein